MHDETKPAISSKSDPNEFLGRRTGMSDLDIQQVKPNYIYQA